jgi:spindle assembly abnormal protein 6
MDAELHTNEKTANQLKTRIAVLEQELKDKVESVQRASESLGSEQSQRKRLDEMLKEKTAELKKKQLEVGYYVKEFEKGSELLTKMRSREKSLVGQVKLKSQILNEQEKVMKEKEKQIEELRAEVKELRGKLATCADENKDLASSLQKKANELDEAAKLLKRDENSELFLH